jgi:hypothetical protein
MAGDTILRRATMAELGRAVEENLFALFRAMTALPAGIARDLGYRYALLFATRCFWRDA